MTMDVMNIVICCQQAMVLVVTVLGEKTCYDLGNVSNQRYEPVQFGILSAALPFDCLLL